MPIWCRNVDSQVGPLVLCSRGETLCGLSFSDGWNETRRHLENSTSDRAMTDDHRIEFLDHMAELLASYFNGELSALSRMPVELLGTPFQVKVWNALLDIRLGQTTSYGELAHTIGHPGASRAVGAANGKNPVAIVVPCHRVIGKSGKLTGYGGGLDRKRWLLEHEGVAVQGELFRV